MEAIHPVIIGGGIIGLSTAYYLLTHPSLPAGSTVTLVERTAIAHGASGRAMGMIGREWQPRHTKPLSRLSWKCYEELNGALGGYQWEWIITPAMGVEVQSGAMLSRYRELPVEKRKGISGLFNGEMHEMTDDGAVAHVNPDKFCQALHHRCLELGLLVIIGSPTSLHQDHKKLSVLCNATANQSGEEIEINYTHLQISAGPWSAALCRKLGLPTPSISNLPGHSIHIQPSKCWDKEMIGKSVFAGIEADISAEEAVNEIALEGGSKQDDVGGVTGSIELVYRPDVTVYIAGENGAPSGRTGIQANGLPEDPGEVASLVDPKLVRRLQRAAAMLSNELDVRNGAQLIKSQLCYRPTSPDGTPQLGWLDERNKVLLAAGHGPWGITLGPGSGHLMADLILGRDPGFPISAFRPARFRLR